MAAEPGGTGWHVAAPPLHPGLPACRRRCLPRRRCCGQHAALCAWAHGFTRAGPAQAAHRAQWHHAGRVGRHTADAGHQPRDGTGRRSGCRAHGGGVRRLDGPAQCAGHAAGRRRPDARLAIQLCAGGQRPRTSAPGATRARRRPGACALSAAHSKGPGAELSGGCGHRLHRLAARAHLPLRHRTQQADGLHDGPLRGAAQRGSRQ